MILIQNDPVIQKYCTRYLQNDVWRVYSLSLNQINRILKGDIPSIRLGGRKYLFKLSEVDAALKQRFQTIGLR